MRVAEHQVLHDEFHVDDAAAVMLDIEQRGGVGVRVQHFLAHLQDFLPKRGEVALFAQNCFADLLEQGADLLIARNVAGACQRLVFPNPGLFVLVLAERFDGAGQQAAGAVGAQA